MLEHEGEDCWDDESMDENEELKEQEEEDLWDKPQNKTDEVQGAKYLKYHEDVALAGEGKVF